MLIDTSALHVVAGTPVIVTMTFRVPATPAGALTDPSVLSVHVVEPDGTPVVYPIGSIAHVGLGIYQITHPTVLPGHYKCSVYAAGGASVVQNFDFYADRASA